MVIASTSSPGCSFHGGNAGLFGQTIGSASNSSAQRFSIPFGSPAASHGSAFRGNESSPFGRTSSGKQCQGSGVASYSATPVLDGEIRSISAMQVYQSKSHEELRSEDYELHKGFTFPIQNQGNAFQPLNSPFDLWTRPVPSSQSMFGSLSGTSTATFGPLPSFRFAEGNVGREASNVSVFKGSTHSSWSTSASGFQATTNECTVSKQCQGSGLASYSATRDDRYSVESIQSISAMPIYKDKSHEELRWEDCQLCNKGGQKHQDGRFFNSSPIGTSDSSPNIFCPAPFEPFKSNISGPKIRNFVTPNITICTAPTLPLSVNPFPPTNLGPFSSIPQHTAVFPMPTSNPFQPSNPSVFNIGNSPALTTSTTPTLSPTVNPFSPTNVYPSQSQASISQTIAVSSMITSNPFQPSNATLSVSKIGNYNAPNNTISTTTTLSPSVNTFSPTTLYPSQSQAYIPQPTAVSSLPAFNPFSESMPANSNQFLKISTTLPSPSFIGPSTVALSPSVQSTPVTTLASWPFTPNASNLGRTSDKVDIPTNDRNQPPQAPYGSTIITQVGSHNIIGQQYVPSRTLGMQSSLVMNPFSAESPIDRPNAAKPRLHGISSIPVSYNHSSNRRSSLLRNRRESFRHHSLSAQSPSYGSSETKVPFFNDEVDAPVPNAPFLPRENPRAWVKNSPSLHSRSNDKCHGIEDNENSTGLTDDSSIQEGDSSATLNSPQLHDDAVAEKHELDILAKMPKLTNGEYYTEPSLQELAAKEMAEPGWCSRVNDFVVGRRGYGSIKSLGDTDVRNLDLESIVQFIGREVIIYPDDRKMPPIGQSLNKRSEVTLVNIKCISKKTGKQYVEGPQVRSYKETLIKKITEQGAEFVSYDPVQAELKFRVQHF